MKAMVNGNREYCKEHILALDNTELVVEGSSIGTGRDSRGYASFSTTNHCYDRIFTINVGTLELVNQHIPLLSNLSPCHPVPAR